MMQDLARFSLPPNFRGRPAWFVQLWWLVQATAFRWSPQIAYGWRVWLLRAFGARVGHAVKIRPSVIITYPWKVTIGDYAWVGDDAIIYSLGEITIGPHAVISQRTHLCAGDHDYTKLDFEIRAKPITIDAEAWVAADVFVAPGVHIGYGTVIGARSSVFSDMPDCMICYGYPCKPVKRRIASETRLNPAVSQTANASR
jgi:putative colanic acid biosynthesis acetyltransferase WcaF